MAKKLADRLAGSKLTSWLTTNDEDESPARVEAVEPEPAVPSRASVVRPTTLSLGGMSPAPVAMPSFTPTMTTTEIDPEMRAKLQAVADGADQKSFTQFMALLQNMRSQFGHDESSCYKAALAAGRAFNLSPTEVRRGLDVILRDLDQADKRFRDAVPQQIASRVGARQQRINQLRQTASSKLEEAARLKEAASRLEAEISELARTEQAETSAMAQDEKSVRDAAAKFTAAMEAVKAPYIAEKQKLDSYGQGL
ncbi:MAG: hypothetical protein A2925_00770 [Candidatus Yanofskybacteria bacterium RIFCSPLOWO2_01_FULL_44_22]|uniref:DUF5667 domain-containing protein n=2 Tax=Candidatus Yanofskyibacteriota TaxID=1752733 RepID=A0A1F8GJ14_9BACT|nr:MAG: hypothetical protein UW79_C0023G0035 [Candidatus Yanofskybacteria bacterium GW2011_GWA2_44_9]OGN04277.1 MAG: hypothetical protein A2659_03260 [Candidatus Yanofskybacteria bacterium RIFCSPHIGHO2_01_FULL_44_24]OGN25384.1 MAG: hypothetical protein A2925_00770 [Candidatus Yanofskybacteria bacterium RIFCSPLOWO2_01_FULL_44_22]